MRCRRGPNGELTELSKVIVERKCFASPETLHQCEAGTVGEAPLLVVVGSVYAEGIRELIVLNLEDLHSLSIVRVDQPLRGYSIQSPTS